MLDKCVLTGMFDGLLFLLDYAADGLAVDWDSACRRDDSEELCEQICARAARLLNEH